MANFDASTTSDQKRLARGEQWLMTRSTLRAWYRTHSSNWRILTLAGGSPAGEINCIRELMPKAHITAVDKDEACVLAAMDAGADDAIQVDLSEFTVSKHNTKQPNSALINKRFHAVHLDLCAGASHETRQLISVYLALVERPGVLLVTFSYGRDVVEFFKMCQPIHERLSRVPENVAARISYLCGAWAQKVASVILYQGNAMPMCSVAIVRLGSTAHAGGDLPYDLSIVKLQEGDFELAVLHPDPRMLYDCPGDRIEALRRSHAALKAVATRRAKEAA